MPAPFSSSAPPPQKKHRADADRSSCRPPELPAPAGPQTALDGFRLSRLISLSAVRAVFDRASAFCCAARVSHAGIGESAACERAHSAARPRAAARLARWRLPSRQGKDGGRDCARAEAASEVGMDQRSTHARNFSERARTFVKSRKHYF